VLQVKTVGTAVHKIHEMHCTDCNGSDTYSGLINVDYQQSIGIVVSQVEFLPRDVEIQSQSSSDGNGPP